jgi:hypothetical protein
VQKAFPKVLGVVLGVIAYGVVLVTVLVGDGDVSSKGWAIVVGVPVAALVTLAFSRRRRPGGHGGRSHNGPGERRQPE